MYFIYHVIHWKEGSLVAAGHLQFCQQTRFIRLKNRNFKKGADFG